MDKDKDTIGIDERGNTQDFFIESCSFFTKKKITGTETFFLSNENYIYFCSYKKLFNVMRSTN